MRRLPASPRARCSREFTTRWRQAEAQEGVRLERPAGVSGQLQAAAAELLAKGGIVAQQTHRTSDVRHRMTVDDQAIYPFV